MELDLYRYHSADEYTQGILLRRTLSKRTFLCYTLEDEYRTEKVYGKTRIPAGRYQLKLRTIGEHHKKYRQRFPSMHEGMLELQKVKGFTNVLFHIGNTDADTAGCVLVGNAAEPGCIKDSTEAYKKMYPVVAKALSSGSSVWLNVIDLDSPEKD